LESICRARARTCNIYGSLQLQYHQPCWKILCFSSLCSGGSQRVTHSSYQGGRIEKNPSIIKLSEIVFCPLTVLRFLLYCPTTVLSFLAPSCAGASARRDSLLLSNSLERRPSLWKLGVIAVVLGLLISSA
jgi:hypothetical protein